MGIAHHKTGHIAPFYCSGPGADADGTDILQPYIGKQPAGKLWQAFDMGKYGIGLAQPQLPVFDGKKLGAVYAGCSVVPCN